MSFWSELGGLFAAGHPSGKGRRSNRRRHVPVHERGGAPHMPARTHFVGTARVPTNVRQRSYAPGATARANVSRRTTSNQYGPRGERSNTLQRSAGQYNFWWNR